MTSLDQRNDLPGFCAKLWNALVHLPPAPFQGGAKNRFRVGTLALALAIPVFAQSPTDPLVLWEQATIYRDEWGVPHIQADNFLAMSFAFGYAQAEDHIESMLRAYRVANGRAAEVYGEEYAASDEFSLKVGHADLALAAFPYADAITRDLCGGFALGVNAWLVEHPGEAPEWADGVRPEDILALMHCYLMSFAPFDLPGTYSRTPAANTGNAWAIGPQRSTTGETILVMNPHTEYRGPFQWYEANLTCGTFNVYGATLFGLPVIIQGHNGALSWALTPNMTDFADVFTEQDQSVKKSNPADPTGSTGGTIDLDTLKYLHMVANSKTYYVRTPAGIVERQVPHLDTPRGPIVGRYNNKLCSWMVGGYRDFGAVRQLHFMGSATNLSEFQEALGLRQLPSFHVVYADREGNLFYVYNSNGGTKFTPPSPQDQIRANRAEGSNSALNIVSWNAPVPGGDPRFAWGETVPTAQLPVVLNPASGYIQACGNPPWLATEGAELSSDLYPPWFALDPDTFRAKRARRLLATDKRSFQDAQAMLYDVLVPGAMYAMPNVIEAADQRMNQLTDAHPDLAPYLDILRNWNYVAELDSEGMTAFHVWWNALCSLAPKGMNEFAIWTALGENTDAVQLLSVQAAEQAARLMRSEFQSLNKTWGDAHVFVRGDHKTPAPGGVTGQPMFVASDHLFLDGAWQVTYGYGFAMAVSFGAQTQAMSMTPFGASEDPASPHYADQLALIADRRLKQTRFVPADVRRYAERARGSVIHVSPRGMQAEFTIRSQSPVTISTSVDTTAPAEVPKGLATFTVYARIDQQPVDQNSLVELNVYVPEEVCAAQNLNQLALYGYDATQGWAPLEAQELD
ncbi:MAG: penicillin acylase family protein, partial [Candidatus Hydrogenedentes bacterium]|nr:penicillin acylase family protein [Candidatus Hydrogenedentota bacterium]